MNKLKFISGDIIKDKETYKLYRVLLSDNKHLLTQDITTGCVNVAPLDKTDPNEFDKFVVEKSIFDYDSQEWLFPEYTHENSLGVYSEKTVIRVIRYKPENGELDWELECGWDLSKGNPVKNDRINLINNDTNISISIPLSIIEDELIKVFIYKSNEDNDGYNITKYLSRLKFKLSSYLPKNQTRKGYLIDGTTMFYCDYRYKDSYNILVTIHDRDHMCSEREYNILDLTGDRPKIMLLPHI